MIDDDVIGFSAFGTGVARGSGARDPPGRLQRRSAVPGGATVLDVGLVRAKVARLSVTGELGYEINCRALEHGALRRTLLAAGGELGDQGIRLQCAPGAEARKELRHLVGRIHPSLYAQDDRHGPLDRLGQGRFHRPHGGARRAQRSASVASARHPGGGRARRRRVRLRAGLAQRIEGRVRHFGRLRAHNRQEPGDGADRAGGGERRRRACGSRRRG